jgi:hypothetical protein
VRKSQDGAPFLVVMIPGQENDVPIHASPNVRSEMEYQAAVVVPIPTNFVVN